MESKLKEFYFGHPDLGPLIAENKQLQSRIAELEIIDNQDELWEEVYNKIMLSSIKGKQLFKNISSKFKLVRIKESN